MSSSVSGIGNLIKESFASCQKYAKAVLIGAIFFGSLTAVINVYVQNRMVMDAGNIANEMNIDIEKMEELSEQMKEGDDEAMGKMMEDLRGLSDMMEDKTEEEMAAMMTDKMIGGFGSIIRTVLLGSSLSILIGILSGLYFLLLAVKKTNDPTVIFNAMPGYILPMIGVMIWTFIRSFVWIPFIGIIIAIVLMPRFVFASYILVTEKRGVFESVSSSFKQTKGHWLDVVVNIIITNIIIMIPLVIASSIVSAFLSRMSYTLSLWSSAIIIQLMMAMMTFVIVFYAPNLIKKGG